MCLRAPARRCGLHSQPRTDRQRVILLTVDRRGLSRLVVGSGRAPGELPIGLEIRLHDRIGNTTPCGHSLAVLASPFADRRGLGEVHLEYLVGKPTTIRDLQALLTCPCPNFGGLGLEQAHELLRDGAATRETAWSQQLRREPLLAVATWNAAQRNRPG